MVKTVQIHIGGHHYQAPLEYATHDQFTKEIVTS